LLAAAMAMTGCANRPTDEAGAEAPLIIEKPTVDLGFVRGVSSVSHDFVFKTWGKGPVTIRKVISSCTCSGVSPDLVQMTLPPNTTQLVSMTMRVAWQPGEKTADVEFLTDPPSPRPLVLKLRTLSADRPVASPQTLNVRAVDGASPRGTLKLTYLRKPTDRPLTLDLSKSNLKPFVLKSQDLRTTEESPVVGQGKVATDVLSLNLEADPKLPIGVHSRELHLVWAEDELPSVDVPVHVDVMHPLTPSVSRVFCGEVSPGQAVTKEVRMIRRQAGSRLRDAASKSDLVKATISDDRNSLKLDISAPERPGRFEAAVVLSYDTPNLPDTIVTVSGIVSPGGADADGGQ